MRPYLLGFLKWISFQESDEDSEEKFVFFICRKLFLFASISVDCLVLVGRLEAYGLN